MNVLFLTLLDFNSIDEQGIYTDLLREFVDNGHRLYIISPVEKRKASSTQFIELENVKILKLQIGNVQKTNIIEKGISTLTLESKFKAAIKSYFDDIKFDLVLYTTPPITLQSSVSYVKRRDKATTYLMLKDIFPQNALDLGMLSKKGLKKYIYTFFKQKEKKLYEISDFIGCMSQANVDFLLKQNPEIKPTKVEICPNTITPLINRVDESNKGRIREKLGISINKKVFLYGGNLGKPQGIPFILDCIRENEKRTNAHFLIIGSGTEFSKMKQFFDNHKPLNATLIESLPKSEYEELVCACDVGLIYLDSKFTIPNFPSRLLSYMQAGLPVLAATDVNTDIGLVIQKGNFGLWCKSGDVNQFNQHVESLINSEMSKEMGFNSRKYLENHYTSKHAYKIIMNHFN